MQSSPTIRRGCPIAGAISIDLTPQARRRFAPSPQDR
jgi:hypothetical protein